MSISGVKQSATHTPTPIPAPRPLREVVKNPRLFKFDCPFPDCLKKFPNISQNLRHQLSQHGTRERPRCPFATEGCRYAGDHSGNMNTHIRIHTNEGLYFCPHPDCIKILKSFTDGSACARHVQLPHPVREKGKGGSKKNRRPEVTVATKRYTKSNAKNRKLPAGYFTTVANESLYSHQASRESSPSTSTSETEPPMTPPIRAFPNTRFLPPPIRAFPNTRFLPPPVFNNYQANQPVFGGNYNLGPAFSRNPYNDRVFYDAQGRMPNSPAFGHMAYNNTFFKAEPNTAYRFDPTQNNNIRHNTAANAPQEPVYDINHFLATFPYN